MYVYIYIYTYIYIHIYIYSSMCTYIGALRDCSPCRWWWGGCAGGGVPLRAVPALSWRGEVSLVAKTYAQALV